MATAPAGGGGGGGGDSHVLREYLVALGFRVDERRNRNFQNTLGRLDKGAMALGRSIIGVGGAAVTMAVLFTRSMERLFYSARYADTTVTKLQEMEFAGRNIGLAGGEMTQGLKSMAGALRANPGLVGMLEKMGVQVKGRDMSDVMWDFVRATKSMPFYVAQQYAEMFGISPEMLFNMQKGDEEARQAALRRRQMVKDLAIDTDALAKDSVELSNIWRDLSEFGSLFGQKWLSDALPVIRVISGTMQQMMINWSTFVNDVSRNPWAEKIFKGFDTIVDESVDEKSGFGQRMLEGLGHRPVPGTRAVLTPEARKRVMQQENLEQRAKIMGKKDAGDLSPGGVDDFSPLEDAGDLSPGGVDDFSPFDPEEHLRILERKYKLPTGALSRINRGLKSEADALRLMALSPEEQSRSDAYERSPTNLRSLERALNEAKRPDERALLQAEYDKQKGNAARLGSGGYLGRSPMDAYYEGDGAAAGGDINVNTDITINGATDPVGTAELVKQRQSDVAGTVVRNMSPRIK